MEIIIYTSSWKSRNLKYHRVTWYFKKYISMNERKKIEGRDDMKKQSNIQSEK